MDEGEKRIIRPELPPNTVDYFMFFLPSPNVWGVLAAK